MKTSAQQATANANTIIDAMNESSVPWRPERLPDTEWLMHFSPREFGSFTRGRPVEQVSINYANRSMDEAEAVDQGFSGFLCTFAWLVEDLIYLRKNHSAESTAAYGTPGGWGAWPADRPVHALMFRASGAVVGHWENQRQAVFRSGTEFDTIRLRFYKRRNNARWEVVSTGQQFAMLADLVMAADDAAGITRKWEPYPGVLRTPEEAKAWAAKWDRYNFYVGAEGRASPADVDIVNASYNPSRRRCRRHTKRRT